MAENKTFIAFDVPEFPFGGVNSFGTPNNEQRLLSVISNWKDTFSSSPAFAIFFDFDKNLINKILNKDECVGLRVFPGVGEDGKITVSVVGLNSDKVELLSLNGFDDGDVGCCPSNGTSGLLDTHVFNQDQA